MKRLIERNVFPSFGRTPFSSSLDDLDRTASIKRLAALLEAAAPNSTMSRRMSISRSNIPSVQIFTA
jgi:hypothetical protein